MAETFLGYIGGGAKGSPLQFSNEYNSALKNEIVECALTYYRNADKLFYGNDSIAPSKDPARQNPLGYYVDKNTFRWTAAERTDNGLKYLFTDKYYEKTDPNTLPKSEHKEIDGIPYTKVGHSKMALTPASEVEAKMQELRAKADKIVMQIDCSSFVQLVMSGVPFENSRYAKWMNTNGDTDNVPFYEWGYKWSDDEHDKYATNRERLGAGNLAQYCYEKGCGIEVMDWEKHQTIDWKKHTPPASASETEVAEAKAYRSQIDKEMRLVDWKKFQTGDLLFRTEQNEESENFRKIFHVMIYLCPCTVYSATYASYEEEHWVIEVGTQDETKETAPVAINRIGPKYFYDVYDEIIYAGRLPITLNRDTQPRNIVKSVDTVLPCTIKDKQEDKIAIVTLEETLKKGVPYTVVVDVDFGDEFVAKNTDLENNTCPEIGLLYNGSYRGVKKKVEDNKSKNYSFTFIPGAYGTSVDITSLKVFSRNNDKDNTKCYHTSTTVRGVSVYEGIYPNSGFTQTEGSLVSLETRLKSTEDSISGHSERIKEAEDNISENQETIASVKSSVNASFEYLDGRITDVNSLANKKMSIELVWQNNSLQEYAAKSFDLKYAYNMYLIVAKVATGTNARVTMIATNGVPTRLDTMFNKYPCYRDITILDGTVTVADCNKITTLGSGMTIDNSILIPEKIYGIDWST